MDEAIGAAGNRDGLKNELEEYLVDGACTDAADAVSQVVLEPMVARAEAKGNFAGDLQEKEGNGKPNVIWRAARSEVNDGCEAGGADSAVEERC